MAPGWEFRHSYMRCLLKISPEFEKAEEEASQLPMAGHYCPGDYTAPVILFSKLNDMFSGYFYPQKTILITKIINFRGDLTDVSSKTVTLYRTIRISTLRLPESGL